MWSCCLAFVPTEKRKNLLFWQQWRTADEPRILAKVAQSHLSGTRPKPWVLANTGPTFACAFLFSRPASRFIKQSPEVAATQLTNMFKWTEGTSGHRMAFERESFWENGDAPLITSLLGRGKCRGRSERTPEESQHWKLGSGQWRARESHKK